MELRGIDISSWSHGNDEPIDFEKVKAQGYGFVMIKATQGTRYKNPYLAEDATEAHHAGLLVGTYHYAVPAENEAVLQAKFAAAAVTGLPLSLGVALDLEEIGTLQDHQLGPWAQEFMAQMNESGHQSPFYVNEDFLTKMVGAPWGHKLWYASANLPEFQSKLPIWMQQTVENTRVDGVPGVVDFDTFYGVRGINATTTQAGSRTAHIEAPDGPTGEATETPGTEDSTIEHGDGSGTGS